MRYLSVCSGIEAASVAWHPLGWTPVAFSEIEPFPAAVLAHRFPNVPNYGDMTKHKEWPLEPGSIDLLVGGTPCQSFSVAGLRKGLSDPRGGLMLTYLEIAQRLRPRWVVWENVPGVLSSGGGRDFGSFLGALGELGYGWAYRVLDAQWVRTHGHPRAVPQRRRRVFVVGCLGNGTAAAEVLFVGESVRRNNQAQRETREEAPADAGGCAPTVCSKWSKGTGGPSGNECGNLTLQPVPFRKAKRAQSATDDETWVLAQQANTLNGFDTGERDTHAVAFNWQNGGGYGNANEGLGITIEGTGPLQRCNTPAVAFNGYQRTEQDAAWPIGASDGRKVEVGIRQAMTVRRLTPRECERLQGFPDDWTLIPWRGKPADQCPDGPRYKALGNSFACNCVAWIGQRIAASEAQHA